MHSTHFHTEVTQRSANFLAVCGHSFLLADTLFFVAALIDAQVKYSSQFTSECDLSLPILRAHVIVSVGYAFRCCMSLWLLYYKTKNMFDFVARERPFPRLGSLCAPFMSMLLLTVTVYDYRHCKELSSLIPVSFAMDIIAVYVLLILCLTGIWGGVRLYEVISKRERKKWVEKTMKIVAWGCVGFGGTLSLVVTVEQIRVNSLTLFLLFDTYSFVAVFLGSGMKCVRSALLFIEKRQSSGL